MLASSSVTETWNFAWEHGCLKQKLCPSLPLYQAWPHGSALGFDVTVRVQTLLRSVLECRVYSFSPPSSCWVGRKHSGWNPSSHLGPRWGGCAVTMAGPRAGGAGVPGRAEPPHQSGLPASGSLCEIRKKCLLCLSHCYFGVCVPPSHTQL